MIKSMLLIVSSLLMTVIIKAQNNYSIINRFHVDGDGGWDYLASDDESGRLFVSHGNVVQVISENTGNTIGTIDGLNGVHGIALAPEFNKAFITSGRDSIIMIVDMSTYTIIEKVKSTGANPDAVMYDPFSIKVFAFNARSSNATVIDASTNNIVKTISLSGSPEFSVSDGNGNIYVNIEDKSEVCLINASSLEVDRTWPLKPGEEPSGLALDNLTHRLFAVCDNKLMVILNANDGKIISTVKIGEHVDGVAFDPELKRAYSSNGDGTLTIVQEKDENNFEVLKNIPTQKGARTICINRKTHHVYLSVAELGEAPPKTTANPHPRPVVKKGTFTVLDVALEK